MRRLEGHRGKVLCVAYASDGQTLASGSSGKIIKLWDVRSGKARATLRGLDYAAVCLAFHPDGHTLASGDSGGWGPPGVVRLWDVASGRERSTLRGYTRPSWITAVAFSPDGADLAAASGNRTNSGEEGGVRVCDAASGAARWSLRQPGGGVLSLAYAPDGGILSLGTLAVGVRLCNPASGREQARLGQKGGVVALAYGPDGRTLAAAAGWSITLWDADEVEVRATLKGHRGPVWSLALSPDGRTLVSGGQDGTVRLWDVASGREQACFDWKLGPVRCVAFAPDGMTAVAAGKAGPLVLWDVE